MNFTNANIRLLLILFYLVLGNFCMQSQNVGIGTDTPQGELHVSAPFVFGGVIFAGTGLNDLTIDYSGYTGIGNTNYAIKITNAGRNPNIFQWSDDGGNSWSLDLPMQGPLIITDAVVIEFTSNFGHTYDDSWSFTTGESYLDGLIVKDSQVGIGTDSPSKKLDVLGDINYSGDLYKNGLIQPYVSNLTGLSDAHHVGTNLVIGDSGIPQGNYNTYIHTLPNNSTGNDNVFIGEASGIANTSGFSNTFIGAVAGNLSSSGSNNLFLGEHAGSENRSGHNNVFLGARSGSDTDGTGNVFIGRGAGGFLGDVDDKLVIANSSSKSLMYGDFYSKYLLINRTTRIVGQEIFGLDSNTGGYGGMYINISGIDPKPFYGFAVEGSQEAWVEYESSSGDMIVNNDNGNFKLNFNDASKPVAGSWLANSDSRLKKNIKSLDQQAMLNKVLAMRGVSYEWNDDKTSFERPVGKQIGFIAQDLQQIWPNKISEDQQGYLQTAYGDYDPVFVEAIKELSKILGQQAEEIDQLKRNLEAFEKILAQKDY